MKSFQALTASIATASFLSAASANPIFTQAREIVEFKDVCLQSEVTAKGIQQAYFAVVQDNQPNRKSLKVPEYLVRIRYSLYNAVVDSRQGNKFENSFLIAQKAEFKRVLTIIDQHRQTGAPDLNFCNPTI